MLQTSAAEVEEAKLKLQQAQAAAEAGKLSQNPAIMISCSNILPDCNVKCCMQLQTYCNDVMHVHTL